MPAVSKPCSNSSTFNANCLFSGYRVLDLTDEKGHLCGRILADFGADVIKIEPPGGDPSRHIGPFYHDEPRSQNSLSWWFANANKRGITLNIEKAEGREIFKSLVSESALVIESYPPGYLGKMGLDYQVLSEINPSIVMTSITPFGQNGPYSNFKASDLTLMAMGGMARLLGDRDRPPIRISSPQAYFLGCLHAAVGSTFALYYRELTGNGQHVDVSIQEAIVLSLMITTEIWDLLKVNYQRSGCYAEPARPKALGPLKQQRVYPCRDGYVTLFLGGGATMGLVKSSQGLVRWANEEGFAEELKDYDWVKHNMATISQEQEDFVEKPIAEFLLTKTKKELLDKAISNSILLAPVCSMKDVAESLQLAARNYWTSLKHPALNQTITYPGAPVKLSQCPWKLYRPPPQIGEHNDEIYLGELGLSSTKIAALKQLGVI
ncbi:MAG TPA: CoA transferase [Dehalococcoidia bacterium]|nr:CoA transferase [Dehalococcoidia bacterium]